MRKPVPTTLELFLVHNTKEIGAKFEKIILLLLMNSKVA